MRICNSVIYYFLTRAVCVRLLPHTTTSLFAAKVKSYCAWGSALGEKSQRQVLAAYGLPPE